MQLPVYMDYNATTPCDPRVVEAMLPYFTQSFGNAASSHHYYGWQAEAAIGAAREQVAKLIGADPREIVFTSGATEAANLAVKGVFEAYGAKGKHIITTNVEHKAVLDTCKFLEKMGAEVTYLPVNNEGLITAGQVEQAIRPETILIVVMYANNELGTLMPVAGIGTVARRAGILLFTDAAQAAGKVNIDVERDNISLLSMSAHKSYGPKGIGALYIRRKNPRVSLTPQMHGGGHERGWRSGTLNVPAIAGFGKACMLAEAEMEQESERLRRLRNKLEQELLKTEDSFVNGSREYRLPHVANIGFKYLHSEALMAALKKEIAISSGSACTSASIEPSYVLKAIGLSNELAHGSLRFGLGRFTTEEEVDFVISQVKKKVEELRQLSPVWQMYKQGILQAPEPASH